MTCPRTHTLAEVCAAAGTLGPDTWTGTRVSVIGRVILKRDLGGLGFATLRDGSGDLQVMVDATSSGRRSTSCGATTSTSATTSASPAR